MKSWWKKWPRGGSAAQPRVWSSVLGIVLGVPGGQYQLGSESCTQQVNQGSYRGEIKDGGSQTSTSEKQPLNPNTGLNICPSGVNKQALGWTCLEIQVLWICFIKTLSPGSGGRISVSRVHWKD